MSDPRIRDFVLTEMGWDRDEAELTAEFPLLEEQAIDSLGVYQLVSFIEEAYGVSIGDHELIPENFSTLAAIDRLVESKRLAAP